MKLGNSSSSSSRPSSSRLGRLGRTGPTIFFQVVDAAPRISVDIHEQCMV